MYGNFYRPQGETCSICGAKDTIHFHIINGKITYGGQPADPPEEELWLISPVPAQAAQAS